jgi:hypothetical protein
MNPLGSVTRVSINFCFTLLGLSRNTTKTASHIIILKSLEIKLAVLSILFPSSTFILSP